MGSTASAAPSATLWDTVLAGVSEDTVDDAVHVAVEPAGGLVLLGFRRTIGAAGADDTQSIFLARLSPQGDELWVREMERVRPFMDPIGVVLTPRGDIVTLATGFPSDGASLPIGVMTKLTDDGDVLWSRAAAPPGVAEGPQGLAIAPDGDLVVAASTRPDGGGTTVGSVRRYSPEGEQRWVSTVTIGARNQLLDVAVDPRGVTHVSGWTRPTTSPADLASGLYAAIDRKGSIVRTATPSVAGANIIAWEVAVSTAGDVFLGGTDRVGSRVPFLKAYAARLGEDGSFAWLTYLEAPHIAFTGGLALTPDGRVVQGGSDVEGENLRAWVRTLSSRTGEVLAQRGQQDPEALEEDVHDVAVHSDRRLTIVGGRRDAGVWRAYASREDATL